jgi:predicted transcriptional regulator
MKADDVKEQLDSLRNEIRNMGQVIHRIREDDVKWIYGEQIRSVLIERSHRFFKAEKIDRKVEDEIEIEERERRMCDLIDHTVTTYQRVGRDKAIEVLDRTSSSLKSEPGRDRLSGNDDFINSIIDQFKRYFEISMEMDEQLELGQKDAISPGPPAMEPPSSELVERTLGPLSSSIRFELMLSLRKGEKGLTDMSREMGLKKGHLQFHIKKLREAGYISIEKRSHLYSLTPKGSVALTGAEELVRRVQG